MGSSCNLLIFLIKCFFLKIVLNGGVKDECRAEGPAKEPSKPALAGPDTGCPLKMSSYAKLLLLNIILIDK